MTARFFHGLCLASALGLLASSAAVAGPVLPVTGTTSGVFTNPSPTWSQDHDMAYSYSNATSPTFGNNPPYPNLTPKVNGATSGTNFRWGDPANYGTGPNQLWWNANNPLATQTETEFKLGTMSYFNGTVELETTPTSIDLKIHLALDSLDGNPISVNQDFVFKLALETTPNTGTAEENADFVKFPNSWPTTIFTVNGVDYTLTLTGFKNATSGGFVGNGNPNEFHVKEGFTASADLMGIITSDIPPGVVPEPASIVSAAVATLACLGFAVRRRKGARDRA